MYADKHEKPKAPKQGKNMEDLAFQPVVLTETDVPGAKLPRPPGECNVLELQRWLECRGVKKTGKKSELVARVEGSLKLNLPLDPKIDGGIVYNQKQQEVPVFIAQIYPTDDLKWTVFPTLNMPKNFNYGNVYHYLVESISLQSATCIPNLHNSHNESDTEDQTDIGDTVTAKPLKKGRNLLDSGFVENVQDTEDSDTYFVRSHVHHSMKNEFPLNVVVMLNKLPVS